MKICILTQPLHTNYGGLLQTFALQTILKRMGHEVWTEDRKENKSLLTPIKNLIRIITRYHINVLNQEKQNKKLYPIISQYTQQFITSHITTTQPIYSKNKKDLHSYNFDAYIVGSDQVWRPRYSPYLYNYFLDFTKGENVKRIAYAASFGTSEWEYSEKQTKVAKELIQKFDAISVREDSGIELCEKYLNKEAVHLLDPTMLLTAQDYLNILDIKDIQEKKQLMVYILDPTKEKEKIIDTISEELQLKVYSSSAKKNIYDYISSSNNNNIDDFIVPSVESWIKAFAESQFIITDSFHGTVFSILFNKPFISISNTNRGLDRFTSLLQKTHLSHRLIKNLNELSKDLIHKKIDFHFINSVLEEEKRKSLSFLQQNLK